MLDCFIRWRYESKSGGEFPVPEMTIAKGPGITLSEGYQYACSVTVQDVLGTVVTLFSPLAIPGPAWSKRHASVTIESLNAKEVRVRFEGDTWSFKSNFANVNVPGRYEMSDGTPLAENASQLEKKKAFFVRIIKRWDVSVDKQADFLVDMLLETIYENTLVVVKWTGDIKAATPVADLKRTSTRLKMFMHQSDLAGGDMKQGCQVLGTWC